IDNIRRVCRGDVYVETLVSDVPPPADASSGPRPQTGWESSSAPEGTLLWQFYRHDELHQDASNWFAPNTVAVHQAFESAGFEMRILKRYGRATLRGRVRAGVPEFLGIDSGEGVYYETLVRHLLGGDRLYVGSPSERSLMVGLASEEYFQHHARSSPAWLASLYPRILGRPAAAAEMNAHLRPQLVGDPAHRQVVVHSLLASPEYHGRLIEGSFLRFLGRAPKALEKETWLGLF